jgi:ABC-2 type transport system ATP-binding protein
MIKVDNLTKKYGDTTVIENISLSVSRGTIYGLIGCNGAGKTTLLKTICGVYKADYGKVTIDDQPVFENEISKSKIFFIQDNPYWLPQYNMKQMMKFYSGYYPAFRLDLFEKLVNLFHLSVDKRISNFSKGMQKQAFITFALSASVDFIVLDETFDGLDPLMREKVQKLFQAAIAKNELGVIVSGHNLKDINEFCHMVGILDNSQLVYNGNADSAPIEEVLNRVNADRDTDFNNLFK